MGGKNVRDGKVKQKQGAFGMKGDKVSGWSGSSVDVMLTIVVEECFEVGYERVREMSDEEDRPIATTPPRDPSRTKKSRNVAEVEADFRVKESGTDTDY
jgi:hypothetical protein